MTGVTPGNAGNQFNFATRARRQPGSTFKTIALAAAVAQGLNPFAVKYLSAPFHYTLDATCVQFDSDLLLERPDLRSHVPRRRVRR